MDNLPWQRRAKAAGLPQQLLAWIVGVRPHAASQALRGKWRSGVPRYLKAVIIAWGLMTPEQRRAWLAAIDAEIADEQADGQDSSPETK